MKPLPEIPDRFAMELAIVRDLPMPLTWYRVWYSRSRFFELRDEGKVETETINGQLCIRPSEFAELIERESVRCGKVRPGIKAPKRKGPFDFQSTTDIKTGTAP